MPFHLSEFIRKRPLAYHLTTQNNLSSIRTAQRIDTAAELIRGAGQRQWLRLRRDKHIGLTFEGRIASVRDQAPLHVGNVALLGGWSFEDLVECARRSESRPVRRSESRPPEGGSFYVVLT